MAYLKKILIIFFMLFYASSSFAAMVTFNQSVTVNTRNVADSGTGSDHVHYGLALSLIHI